MTIRIDFGQVFPGIVLIIVGVCLFVLWLLLVFVSFFAFFVPGLGGIFYIALDILVSSIVLMGLGALIMLAGVSGWWSKSSITWGTHTSAADKDRLTSGQRSGEVFGVIVSFLILLFFIENQLKGTGFFTSRFGPLEEALFYGSWVMGAIVSLARAAIGGRNAVRPLDALYGAPLVVTGLMLLRVFPFDFSHFPDLLPQAARFAFSWVSDPIGRIALVFMAIGGFANMLYNAVVYAVSRSTFAN